MYETTSVVRAFQIFPEKQKNTKTYIRVFTTLITFKKEKQGLSATVQLAQNVPTSLTKKIQKSFFFKLVSFFLGDGVKGSEQKQ